MRWNRIAASALTALALAGAAAGQPADHKAGKPQAEGSVDRLDAALEQRIAGKASLNDIRIDATWRRQSEILAARIYGDGVGIWHDKTQFSLTREQVLDLLRALRDARFGAMPEAFGAGGEGEEGEEEEKQREKEKVFLRGSVSVRLGASVKRVAQYMEGDQSETFEKLVEKILGMSEKAAKTGVSATSLSDGLAKLASGKLAPPALQLLVQSRADRPGETGQGDNWILRIDGRRVLDRTAGADGKTVSQRLLTLDDEDFRALAGQLRDADPQALPRNLFSTRYVHLNVRVLSGRADLTARRYAGKTAETLGAKQAAFDRLYAALEALHARAEKTGAAVPDTAE